MLTATIENALNRELPRSPRAQQLCAGLAGRRIGIEVTTVGYLTIDSDGHSLHLSAGRGPQPAHVDAHISGSPLGLLALGGDAPQAVLQRRGVSISGDAAVAEQFRELAMLLRPDLEEHLSRLLGDIPAHALARAVRGAAVWGRMAMTTAVANCAEYFAHETRDLVSRNEGETFLRGVDSLREDVDRLEARIDLLLRA